MDTYSVAAAGCNKTQASSVYAAVSVYISAPLMWAAMGLCVPAVPGAADPGTAGMALVHIGDALEHLAQIMHA